MLKKIMLVLATLAVFGVAYQILQWQDDTLPVRDAPDDDVAPPPRHRRTAATQPAGTTTQPVAAIKIGEAEIGPGEAPFVRIYDDKGNAKIVFRATEWSPIAGTDNQFQLVEPTMRLLLPDGQLAYFSADEGEVTLRQADDSNLDAQSGWFRGNVRIFVDLTRPEWRQAHPDRSDPEQHPESMVRMWLEDVRFDLDLTRLDSDGPIELQSTNGTLKGKGLTMIWNEVDRQIRYLSIKQGERATLRNVDLSKLALGGQDEPKADAAETRPADETARAERAEPEAPGERELTFVDLDEEDASAEDQLDTYQVVFRDNIVVTQKDGLRVTGRLEQADVLELLIDFGQEDRDALERSPGSPAAPTTQPTGGAATAPADTAIAGRSTVDLRWTGPLEVTPIERPESKTLPDERQIHLLVKGSPLMLSSRGQGELSCLELEYHDETDRIWMRGSPDQLVSLRSSPTQELMGENIFVDQNTRSARVEGPGRLVDHRSGWGDGTPLMLTDAPATAPAGLADEVADAVQITWTRSVDITFALSDDEAGRDVADVSFLPEGAYLEHAVFEGDVTFAEAGRSIRADDVDVTFVPGPAGADASGTGATPSAVVDHIVATGNVRMVRQSRDATEYVHCDRLDVDMTVDDAGGNVPAVARATGRVLAQQVMRDPRPWRQGEPVTSREMRAEDGMVIELASVPKPLSEGERTRLEAWAEQQGIKRGSVRWEQYEQRLADRREIVATRMKAQGQVVVRDVEQELDLVADKIDCTFGRSGDTLDEIERAIITGRKDQPARVEFSDFFIRGPMISVDVVEQSAEVPGAGTLRFLSRQDLDGRTVGETIPVVVTWADRMLLEGPRNNGWITGSVHVVSESLTLDCDELQLRFEDLPNPAKSTGQDKTAADSRWILGPVVDSLRGDRPDSTTLRMGRSMRKRLASLYARGNAVARAAVYEEVSSPGSDAMDRLLSPMEEWLAEVLPTPEETAGQPPEDTPLRLTSRLRMAGPLISVNLIEERLAVEGEGNLLIEDYRWTERRPRTDRPSGESSYLDASSMASLERVGPSQTIFEWTNSMTFFNSRNAAHFDRDVVMAHLAGSKMVELEGVALAMKVDPERLRQLEGRKADLSCDRLLVEFERKDEDATEPSPLSRAARLKTFWSTGRVRLAEGNVFVIGSQVSYNSTTGIGRVDGSPRFPARLGRMDPRTGRPDTSHVEFFEWNQKSGMITARHPRALATGQ